MHPSPRITDRKKTFVELMVLWARYELEQREDKRRLERQNDRLDSVASIVSHDLRNPLTVARGRLDIAIKENDVAHLKAVDRALDRMHEIVDEVLTLVWTRRKIRSDEMVSFSLANAAESSWQYIETKNATLRIKDDFAFQANRARLRQLFENLFRNAVEHGGDDVTVRVGALSNGFYVEDDGPGIPSAKQDKIFEAGYTSREDGTGLGLSIVKTVAEAHGWSLSITEGTDGGVRLEVTEVAELE